MKANRRFLSLLLAAGAGTFLFSDFYFPGIARVFDYLFLALVGTSLLFVPFRFDRRHPWIFLAAFVIMLPWLVAGAMSGSALVVASVSSGILLASMVFGKHALEHKEKFDHFLKISIVIALSVFWLQFILQYSAGFYLDIHSWVGSIKSRGWNEDLGYFRASGIFQEPNAFCTVMFCLLSARALAFHKKDWTFPFGLISMVFSLSLWGFVGAVILSVLVFKPRTSLIICGIAILGVLGALYISGISVDSLVDDSITLRRISNLEDDPSKQDRVGSIDNYLNYDNFEFGSGVNSGKFQTLAANSYGFLFYAFGLFGVLIIALAFSTRLITNWRGIVTILYLFTTFPPFSYMYFWIWLAIILNASSTSRTGNDLCAV